MWDVIAKVSERRTVILTTHSMEESEALCSRVGIMVKGQIQCLGTCQHLKSRFGDGYETQIRSALGRGETVSSEFLSLFPSSNVLEQHCDFYRIRTTSTLDLAHAFTWLEGLKSDGSITDYSLTQTSLEQIFVAFAGDAAVMEEEVVEAS